MSLEVGFMGNCESRNAGTRNGSNVASHRKLWHRKSRSTVASQQLLRVATQPSFVGPAAYPWKTFRSRDVFPLEPVHHFALTEVNIAKQNSQLLPMQMSLPNFARLQYTTTYMHAVCKVGIPISQWRDLGSTLPFFASRMKSPSESPSDRLARYLESTAF